MTFEQVWPLLLIVPLGLGTILASYRSRTGDRSAINVFGTLLLLAFCSPPLVPRESSVAAETLAQALTGLSDTDLKRGKDRILVIETITGTQSE
jgi:hypothetical protein